MDIFLALDIGDKKTGIAKSDIEGIVVSPVNTIKSSEIGNFLNEFQETYTIQKLIIGLPKNMDGSEGKQAQKVRKVVDEIKKQFPELETHFEDERLTSEAAAELLAERGIQIKQGNKELVDQYAALIILKQYLNNL